MRIEAKFDREKIWRQGNSVRYLVVRAVAPESLAERGGEAARAALNIALVIDASGSMMGEPLGFAIEAARRVIQHLTDRDRLSVVSFHSTISDHLISEPMTAAGRDRAMRMLENISALGNTNLSGGWLRGAEHVAAQMESSQMFLNRVIVLSDGHANQGIVDPVELARHAKELSLRGLYSSTVGIGDDYHSETLEAIAIQGGGAHHRAARPNEIVEVVGAELDDIRLTAAESVKITIHHVPEVRIKSLNDFPLSHHVGESLCELGSLLGGASRTAIFRVRFPAGDIGSQCPFEVRLQWRNPRTKELQSTEPIRLTAQFVSEAENEAQLSDPVLTEEVAQVWQAQIVRRVVRLNREGRYAEASRRMDQELPLFSKYARKAANGRPLIAELEKLRDAASREWEEGNRKEVELAMYKRAYSRPDARMSAPAPWSDFMPD